MSDVTIDPGGAQAWAARVRQITSVLQDGALSSVSLGGDLPFAGALVELSHAEQRLGGSIAEAGDRLARAVEATVVAARSTDRFQ